MSWFRWFANVVFISVLSIFWVSSFTFLLDKTHKIIRESLEFWLTRKKALLAELEKELDRRTGSGSYHN